MNSPLGAHHLNQIRQLPNGDELIIMSNPQGERVMLSMPKIPDDAPELVREGIARRRLTAVTGECPCGARVLWPDRAARRRMRRSGEATQIRAEHEDDCPAITANILAAIGDWKPGYDIDCSGDET